MKSAYKTMTAEKLLLFRRRLSKNLYNEKGRPPYPYKSAKSRDLCVAFCTSQGRGAPLVRWPDGHTFFGPVAGRPYFLCFSAYNRPGAGAQYGSGGTPPAPCKNSKKWPKPLFRHAQKAARKGGSSVSINPRPCHSEPVTDVTGVGIRNLLAGNLRKSA